MRASAAGLLLTGCANYLYVDKQFGPGDTERYRLGSVPWAREKQIEEDLCGPKQIAAKWALGLVAARVLTAQQADDVVRNTCFNRANPHGPNRFDAQRELSRLADSLRRDQIAAINNTLKTLDSTFTVERLSGLTSEAKLALTLLGTAAVGTVGGLAASGAFSNDNSRAPGGSGADRPILPPGGG